MKRKTVFNLLVGLAIVTVLVSGSLAARRVWALEGAPSSALAQGGSRFGAVALQPSRVLSPFPSCTGGAFQIGPLPLTDSDTTVGGGDDYSFGGAVCAGGGGQAVPGTGVGPDVVYTIMTDRTCTLNVSMDPTGSDDLALYVEYEDCSDVAGSCVIVDDDGIGGIQEEVQFQAAVGMNYYIIVDGYNGASGPYDLTISEVTSTGCRLVGPERSDLGDAPDSSNHYGMGMTTYPSGVTAHFPTVYDLDTGAPPGPVHWVPRVDSWLGSSVTEEYDADWSFDGDGRTNIDPAAGQADRDGADDGLAFPVELPDCVLTTITYTVTVAPGAPVLPRFVNLWVDYNRDGDWGDTFATGCPLTVPEWAVQDAVVTLGPGTHTLTTPWVLPYNKTPEKPLWVRITLSELSAPSPYDGRGPGGGYMYGETEDYYLCNFDGSYYPCNAVYLPLVLKN